MSNELAIIEHVNGTSLEVYRDRNEVRELAQRLLSLHPAASEVGQAGMFAVAQLALMIGASPLPGVNEIHVWKTGNKIQFQLGINYFRRMAQELGGVIWHTQPRQMNDRERQEYGIVQGQLAAICKGIRIVDMEKFLALNFPANQIFDMLAATGISTAGINEGKHGRPAVWTALKRCEVDLYKQLFPTMMQNVSKAQLNTPDVVIETDGPDWGDVEEFEKNVDIDAINGDLYASYEPEPTEAEYEEVPETAETQEPAGVNVDARSWLEGEIKDSTTTLAFVVDAAAMTPHYNHANRAMNALKKYEGLPDGFRVARSQVVTGLGALKLFDWLMERKADAA